MNSILESCQKLPNSEYIVADISDEAYREVVLPNGFVYRIDKPIALIIRKGGSTHRVVDAQGVAHCYVAPESGKSVLRWKNHDEDKPVNF